MAFRISLLYLALLSACQSSEPNQTQLRNLYASANACEMLEGLIDAQLDPAIMYEFGYLEFLGDNYEGSYVIAEYIEANAGSEDQLAAALFLKGMNQIYGRRQEAEALENLKLSLDLYRIIDNPTGVFFCYLGLAIAHSTRGDMEQCDGYLMLAFRLGVREKLDLGMYHTVAGSILLERETLKQARAHFEDGVAFLSAVGIEAQANTLSLLIASSWLLEGNIEKARERNDPLLDYFREHRSLEDRNHAQLNAWFIGGCEGEKDFNPGITDFQHALFLRIQEKVCPKPP